MSNWSYLVLTWWWWWCKLGLDKSAEGNAMTAQDHIKANTAQLTPQQLRDTDKMVGNKPRYKLMEVLGWLGYCCPSY